MTNAAYFREWRAAHPEYRQRQRDLRRARRARNGRGDRTAEYRARAARRPAVEPMPTLHQGHPLFDAARAVVGRATSGLTILLDPLHEDLLSEAVLALLEGRDPAEAVRRFRAHETAWRRVTGPLLEGAA